MLLLVVLPCVPGLIFLLAGLVRDPRWSALGQMPPQAGNERAAQQTLGLYKAGAAVLAAGVLCGNVVVWQIVRRREDDGEEKDDLA